MMLEQLRQLPPVISCQSPVMTGNGKSGKSARTGNVSKKAEMKKRKAKNLIKLEQKATPGTHIISKATYLILFVIPIQVILGRCTKWIK